MGNFFQEFMKKVHKQDNLWDVLWVAHIFYDVLGLSPVQYRGAGMIPVVKRVPKGAIGASLIGVGLFIVHSVTDIATVESNSYILRDGMRWFYQFISAFTCLVGASNAMNWKKIYDLILSEYEFDVRLSAIGFQIDQKAQNRWMNSAALLITSILVALMTITAYLTYRMSHGSWIKFSVILFSLCAINIVISNYIGQTVIFEYCLQFRFKALRRYFCQLFPTEPELVNNFRLASIARNRLILMERITQLADLHYFLVQLTDRFSSIYTFQLLLTHLGASTAAIITWFSTYRVIVSAEGDSIFVVSINASWSVYYTIYQFMYTLLGAQVSFEAKKMGAVVHKAIEFVTDEDIRDELLLFSEPIGQRCPEVSCQLFVINGSLILSTLGFVCTYLVVLVQFDLTSNN